MSQSPVARKDGQSDEQAQSVQHSILNDYYVQDGPVDRGDRAVEPPKSPAPKKKTPKTPAKKAAKATTSAPVTTATPVTTSAPVITAAPVTASAPVTAQTNTGAPRRTSLRSHKPTAKAISAKAADNQAAEIEIAEASASTPTPAATVQKHTGRFQSIRSQIKPAKKIVKPAKAVEVAKAMKSAEDTGDFSDHNVKNDGSKKGKKTKADSFNGHTDGHGSSLEKPEDAPNDQPWKCANRNCNSGQTWHNRDGKDTMGRKVVSNYFGRNKKATNIIPPDVWHNYCRKDYQRQTYKNKTISKEAECEYYIDNIRMQLLRIKLWRPEAKFEVQLTKGAETRLQNYNTAIVKNNNDREKAKEAVHKPPTTGKKGEEHINLEYGFPIEYISHFKDTFTSAGHVCDKDFDYLETIMVWIHGLVAAGEVICCPPMEFLINEKQDGETVNDPTTNYEQWAEHEDAMLLVGASQKAYRDAALDDMTDDTSEDVADAIPAAQPIGVVATTEAQEDLNNASDAETELNTDGEASEDESDDDDSDVNSTPAPPVVSPVRKYRLYKVPGTPAMNDRSYKFLVRPVKRRHSSDEDEATKSPPAKKQHLTE